MQLLIIVFLLSLSALFSGLNLGLMSLAPHELRRKKNLGDKNAAKLYPVRQKGNFLLVTLLVGNVAVNSTLAIFLGSVVIGLVAIVVSTALITLFGEIIPQALFARYAMVVGARMVWVVKIFMFLLYPICAPIAALLDKVLGEELPTVYSRHELVEILREHSSNTASDLQADEERIASGALTFGNKPIKDVMTPRIAAQTVTSDQLLDDATLTSLKKHGYSRYPVLDEEKERVVGILYTQDLMAKKAPSRPVKSLLDPKVYFLHETDNLDTALRAFLKTRHHLYIVVNEFQQFVGIVTLEDVLEEIIGKEIIDEFDEFDDIRKVAKRAAPQAKSK